MYGRPDLPDHILGLARKEEASLHSIHCPVCPCCSSSSLQLGTNAAAPADTMLPTLVSIFRQLAKKSASRNRLRKMYNL